MLNKIKYLLKLYWILFME